MPVFAIRLTNSPSKHYVSSVCPIGVGWGCSQSRQDHSRHHHINCCRSKGGRLCPNCSSCNQRLSWKDQQAHPAFFTPSCTPTVYRMRKGVVSNLEELYSFISPFSTVISSWCSGRQELGISATNVSRVCPSVVTRLTFKVIWLMSTSSP